MKTILFAVFILFSASLSYPGKEFTDFPIRLNSIDKLVIHVLDSINPISVEKDIEYGRSVYMVPGDIRVTSPMTDSLPHKVLIHADTGLLKKNYIRVASYHTHAATNPGYLDETFSSLDTTDTYVVEYLATPMGKILKYSSYIGKMMILNRNTQTWEYYEYEDYISDSIPIRPKLQLYDKIHPSILGH